MERILGSNGEKLYHYTFSELLGSFSKRQRNEEGGLKDRALRSERGSRGMKRAPRIE
jgi:hypothetical protein